MNQIDRPVIADNQPMGWASDVAAEMLRRMGIKYISLNPGASYRGLHDSIVNYLGNQDPQMILCLHEDHAVAVAHGYAKVTGEPMACALHSNVGLLHGLMGIFNAWCDRAPVVVMGATGPVDAPLRRPWIDWIHTAKDQGALLRNFTKFDDEPRSAAAIVEGMLRAGMLCKTKPTGPVYMCLDAGLQEEELKEEVEMPDMARYETPAAPAASPEDLAEAADLLAKGKNVLIMAGRMSRKQEDWDRRVRIAELLGAGVVTDAKNRAAFPTDHALHVAPPGGTLSEASKIAVREADVILALDWVDLGGTFRSAAGSKDKVTGKVINCTLDSYLHNGWSMDYFALPPSDVQVLADPDAFLAQLEDELKTRLGGKSKWDGKPKAVPIEMGTPIGEKDQAGTITPKDIGLALAECRDGRKLTITKTNIGWAAESYPFKEPMDYIGSDGGGGLGGGPGTAVGAGLALKDSDRIPVAVLGDGDFMQAGSVLWTTAHYEIPVLFVISNNRSNFNDEIHQETVAKIRNRPPENRWIGQRIDKPELDLAGYAKSQGVQSIGPVEKLGDLIPALEKGLDIVAGGQPCLVDVRVERGYSPVPMMRQTKG